MILLKIYCYKIKSLGTPRCIFSEYKQLDLVTHIYQAALPEKVLNISCTTLNDHQRATVYLVPSKHFNKKKRLGKNSLVNGVNMVEFWTSFSENIFSLLIKWF